MKSRCLVVSLSRCLKTRLISAVFPLLLLTACGGDVCRTPFGEGGTLDLLQPDFISLYNSPGQTLVINRGYRGILVHCTNLSEYVAFDCACPHCREVGMTPDDPRHAAYLECPECGSRYDVFFGNPLQDALSPCPLFQYNTAYDGRYLTIY